MKPKKPKPVLSPTEELLRECAKPAPSHPVIVSALERGANPNATWSDGEGEARIFKKLMLRAKIETIKAFVDKGVNIYNDAEPSGYSPLQDAVWCKRNDVVALLLDTVAGRGENVVDYINAKMGNFSATRVAVSNGTRGIVQLFRERGADISDPVNDVTIGAGAASQGHLQK